MINTPKGKPFFTEIYNLVGEGGEYPVEATIDYQTSGPEKWGVLNIPAFTTPDGNTLISAYQFESSPTFSNFNVIKGEIFTVAQDYFNNQGLISPSFILVLSDKQAFIPPILTHISIIV